MSGRQNFVPKGWRIYRRNFIIRQQSKPEISCTLPGRSGRNEKLEVVEGKEAQFAQAFENVKKVLASAGAKLEDIIDMVTYFTDMRDLPVFIQVKDRYITKNYPAWTAIATPALAMPGLMVEIKCVAFIQD